jgi:hypothetical protein
MAWEAQTVGNETHVQRPEARVTRLTPVTSRSSSGSRSEDDPTLVVSTHTPSHPLLFPCLTMDRILKNCVCAGTHIAPINSRCRPPSSCSVCPVESLPPIIDVSQKIARHSRRRDASSPW